MLRLFDVRKAKATARIEPWLLFVLLSLVELKCHIEKQNQLFFKISIATMDNEIARTVAPVIFFVSQKSKDTVNGFPYIHFSAKIDI